MGIRPVCVIGTVNLGGEAGILSWFLALFYDTLAPLCILCVEYGRVYNRLRKETLVFTQEQKEQLAIEGNKLLQNCFHDFLAGYPEATQAIGRPLTSDEKLEVFIDAFTAILRSMKKSEPELLTNPFLWARLVMSPPNGGNSWQLASIRAQSAAR